MTALLAVLSLLFTQLAWAGHVCPGNDANAMREMMVSGHPCDGMDAAQPTLCHEHATSAAQAFTAAKALAPSLPAIIQVLVVPPGPDAQLTVAPAEADAPELRPPPDPLFLATLRLRV